METTGRVSSKWVQSVSVANVLWSLLVRVRSRAASKHWKSRRALSPLARTCCAEGPSKPRTSPHDFQGLGVQGLEVLGLVREATGLPVVTEVMDVRLVDTVAEYADMLQVGSRNMQNYPLLKEVGRAGKPVLLKKGMAASLCEWLGAAEYIAEGGNYDLVLCERGIKSYPSGEYSR